MRLNQYLITNNPSIKIEGFNTQLFNGYTIHSDTSLKTSLSYKLNNICIIGYIFNPITNENCTKNIADILSNLDNEDAILEYIEQCSGRFLILFKTNNDIKIINDFLGTRRVFYFKENANHYISSCDKLLLGYSQKKLNINSKVKDLKDNALFLKVQEHLFVGDTEWDQDFKILQPNHILNINSFKANRIKIYCTKKLLVPELVTLNAKIIDRTIKHIDKIGSYKIALTAGIDSRVLVGSVIKNKLKSVFFTFTRNDAYVKRDNIIAEKICKTFNLKHQSIKLKPLTNEFLNEYKSQFTFPRILGKTKNIQWLKYNYNKKYIITANGAGIIKSPHNYLFKIKDYRDKRIGHLQNEDEKKDYLNKWINSNKDYIKKYNFQASDLFYLEEILSKFVAKWSYELDFSNVEDISPYNNKYLIYSILFNTTPIQRPKSGALIQKELLSYYDKKLLSIPINPKILKDYIKQILLYNQTKKIIQPLLYRLKKQKTYIILV
ncbi:hypothetical protein [Aurantibacter sp.]|uniref:hypothetical protein n=1 Tax=Aurantibacter sp. TaxID=2807103 RepID=UPI0035C84ECE